jgi:hypothetical protein
VVVFIDVESTLIFSILISPSVVADDESCVESSFSQQLYTARDGLTESLPNFLFAPHTLCAYNVYLNELMKTSSARSTSRECENSLQRTKLSTCKSVIVIEFSILVYTYLYLARRESLV